MPKPNSIFISYRRSDSSDVVGRIHDRLIAEFDNPSIFLDVDSISLGLDFRIAIEEQVSQCQVLLAVIGSQWLTVTNPSGERRIDAPDDWVRFEIEAALRRKVPIIPLLVRGATMPKTEDLPDGIKDLAYRNGLPIRSDPDFHRDVDTLIAGIREHLGRGSALPVAQPHVTAPGSRLRRSQRLRAEFLTVSLDDCESYYRAVSEELRVESDPIRKVKLQSQQDQLLQKMDNLEQELFGLGAMDG